MSMRLSRSIVGEAEAEAVRRVIVEDGYLGMGHETCLFEQELAAYLGVAPEQVVTTNTGTAALTLAVDAIPARCRPQAADPGAVPDLRGLLPGHRGRRLRARGL